jgi:Mlc titration factor MtfA (ptsG expression regulator)
MFAPFRRRRRDALRAQPFPESYRAVLARNVPYVARLPEADRRELEGLVQVFLAEKTFEGAGGFELTDEVKVTIAAQACLLLLHRDNDDYPELVTIVVYPSAYLAPHHTAMGGGVVLEGEQARLGESWDRGVVVLSWDDVLRGGRNPNDGQNVVLHEFAHQLDQESGEADGAPPLPYRGLYAPWARILGAEFEALNALVEAGKRSDLDAYGATNPAEFFAVVTETFFEKPKQLRARHPDLYEAFSIYYAQDPAALTP